VERDRALRCLLGLLGRRPRLTFILASVLRPAPSCPDLFRASTIWLAFNDVDGWPKPGYDRASLDMMLRRINNGPPFPKKHAFKNTSILRERDDGTIDARLEIFLSEVEGRAAPVYEGLLEGRLPRSPQSRFDFAQFLALLHTRTTAMRRMFAEITGRMTQIHNYAYAANRKAFEGLMCRFEAVQGETIDSALKEKIRQAMLDPSGYIIEMSQERTISSRQSQTR
jgi:Protein of unknown function (DUF4238)